MLKNLSIISLFTFIISIATYQRNENGYADFIVIFAFLVLVPFAMIAITDIMKYYKK